VRESGGGRELVPPEPAEDLRVARETNGHALVEAIRRVPGRMHRVLEEGIQSAWLYETLGPHLDEIAVAGITESRGQKSDRRDAK
jgi:hypothetical protein